MITMKMKELLPFVSRLSMGSFGVYFPNRHDVIFWESSEHGNKPEPSTGCSLIHQTWNNTAYPEKMKSYL